MKSATKNRILLLVALSFLILTLVVSVRLFLLPQKITIETKEGSKTEIVQVTERSLPSTVVLPGLVVSSKTATIISRTGGKVTKV